MWLTEARLLVFRKLPTAAADIQRVLTERANAFPIMQNNTEHQTNSCGSSSSERFAPYSSHQREAAQIPELLHERYVQAQ